MDNSPLSWKLSEMLGGGGGGNVLLNLNLYYKGKYRHLTGNLKGVCEIYVLRLQQCIQSHKC